ncbi:MAG: hypothetical protein AAF205_09470 [Pseudomonadota bacterium]
MSMRRFGLIVVTALLIVLVGAAVVVKRVFLPLDPQDTELSVEQAAGEDTSEDAADDVTGPQP